MYLFVEVPIKPLVIAFIKGPVDCFVGPIGTGLLLTELAC